MVIFDCNGVLVDSEPIASAVLAEAPNDDTAWQRYSKTAVLANRNYA